VSYGIPKPGIGYMAISLFVWRYTSFFPVPWGQNRGHGSTARRFALEGRKVFDLECVEGYRGDSQFSSEGVASAARRAGLHPAKL